MFQSTRPRGARLQSTLQFFQGFDSFNPRARGGRDIPSLIPLPVDHLFQSTRPRGARLCPCTIAVIRDRAPVSIHAPAGGATPSMSIHANDTAFQSTRPRGARPGGSAQALDLGDRFNPRARGGRDARDRAHATRTTRFQSTRPRGARPTQNQALSLLPSVSIHAPAGGATGVDGLGIIGDAQVSIHAPAGGATGDRRGRNRPSPRFNPRARGGRDTVNTIGIRKIPSFQSTRPRGARLSA